MRTISVQFGSNIDQGRKTTVRYSKVRPLVITKSVDGKGSLPYVLTHTVSGMTVVRLPTLRQAYHALWLLLPLADWRQGYQALQHNAELLRKCREAVETIGAKITTRSY